MGIWLYQNENNSVKNEIVCNDYCIFCKTKMRVVREIELKRKNKWNFENRKQIKLCPVCGWWTVIQKYGENGQFCGDPTIICTYGSYAVLKKLDLVDVSLPIEDVSDYLLAKYEERFLMSPRLFEETVAAAFRNAGYYARTTAYQNDGGIDVILDGKDNKTIGVQVKRYKNSIKVSQIREFAGALIENDMTKGIFVTTSEFQCGAYKSASNYSEKGIGIKLINSDMFYDALQIKKEADDSLYEEIIKEISGIKLINVCISKLGYENL